MLHRHILALGLLAGLGACGAADSIGGAFEGTTGGTHDYSALEVALPVDTEQSVAVAVIDQRPYVVDGDESEDFVGTMPGRYRNTVDVATESGRPFAAIVAEAIAGSLQREGVDATAVPVEEGTAEAEALAALAATGADRLLVVRVGEWQVNVLVRVTARWQLEATVHDRAGELLGRRASQGTETVGTTRIDEESGAMAVRALGEKLRYLLGDPAITRALEG